MRHSPLTFATHTGKHEEGLRKPMTHLWGKAIAAAVVVAGAGLGLTGTANAASTSVYLQLCNAGAPNRHQPSHARPKARRST